jgi:hypothetical protein
MLNHCQECTAAYAVGLKACPQCGTAQTVTVTAPPGLQEPEQRPETDSGPAEEPPAETKPRRRARDADDG